MVSSKGGISGSFRDFRYCCKSNQSFYKWLISNSTISVSPTKKTQKSSDQVFFKDSNFSLFAEKKLNLLCFILFRRRCCFRLQNRKLCRNVFYPNLKLIFLDAVKDAKSGFEGRVVLISFSNSSGTNLEKSNLNLFALIISCLGNLEK